MREIDVYAFGAVGDGIADDTAALQAAIDEGHKTGLPVHLLPGEYSVGELHLYQNTVITAEPTWGYRDNGVTKLLQRYENQRCVLDITESYSCTLEGFAVVGLKTGDCIGILSAKTEQAHMEDAYRLQKLKVTGFGGDGVRFCHAWCFTLRQNMFGGNGGDGLHLSDSFDGFISDTWMSGNKGCGYGTSGENNAITMSACRVEWNRGGGIVIRGGSHYQLTGNYIDRSGKQGIYITTGMDKNGKTYSNTISVTGNIIYRSGKAPADEGDIAAIKKNSCHIAIESAAGVTVCGNTMCIGRDDRGVGVISPLAGMRILGCKYCVVQGNTLYAAALDELIVASDNEETVLRDNPGSLFDKRLEANTAVLPSTAAVTDLFEAKEQV